MSVYFPDGKPVYKRIVKLSRHGEVWRDENGKFCATFDVLSISKSYFSGQENCGASIHAKTWVHLKGIIFSRRGEMKSIFHHPTGPTEEEPLVSLLTA